MGECKKVGEAAIKYSKGLDEFMSKEINPETFWKSMPESGLKKIALRVLAMLPHSASVERLFSRLTYIKNKWQNRMSPNTLTGLAQIKLKLRADGKKTSELPSSSSRSSNIETATEDDEQENSFATVNETYQLVELPIDESELISTDIAFYFDLNLPPFKAPEVVVAVVEEPIENFGVDDVLNGLSFY